MYVLHRFSSLFHRFQRFLVDIRGFDGIYLLLECANLSFGLLEGMFMLLLSFESCLCGYIDRDATSVK